MADVRDLVAAEQATNSAIATADNSYSVGTPSIAIYLSNIAVARAVQEAAIRLELALREHSDNRS